MTRDFLSKKRNINVICALLIILEIAIGIFVYGSGGTAKVYTHFMYIPIVIASSILGKKRGLLIALTGGLLIGPFLPQDVARQIPQQTINWFLRMCIFVIVAMIIGYLSDYHRKNRKRITEMLTHDEKTGLKNIEAVKNEDLMDGKAKTIVLFSIKGIQDTMSLFGYFFESEIICELASILKNKFAKCPNVELYQYLGTQFVLKIGEETKETDSNSMETKQVIQEIQDIDKSILTIDNIPIYLEVRMGIAKLSGDVTTFEGIRQAQVAYSYAQMNKMKAYSYDPSNDEYFKDIQNVAGAFSDAISNQKIGVAFQNIVSSSDEQRSSVELLVRWQKDDGTFISPNTFIPIIENTELIQDLTKYIITCAIQFIKVHSKEDLTVSINFSKMDFENESIDFLIKSIVEEGINPSSIQVEVIERNLINIKHLDIHINRLREHGIKIALDDFGTEYSSYQFLSELMLDTVKLDKSLIYNIHMNQRSERLVRSIVNFCTECGIQTVAEGVETEEIANVCKEIGIDHLQGFYYHRPELFVLES